MTTNRLQVEYFEVPDEFCVWSETEQLVSVGSDEKKLISEAKDKFPIHSDIMFDFEPIADRRLAGNGRVLGYVLRHKLDFFNDAYVYLLVMSRFGITKVNLDDCCLAGAGNISQIDATLTGGNGER